MKILIGSTEICGWVSLFKETLIKAGHECYSVIDEKNRFNYKDNYNIIINNYIIKHSSKNRILRKAIAETNKLIPEIILKTVVNYAKNKFEIVIFFWRSFYPDSSDIKILHDAGVKIIFYFVGSDVRDLNTFIQDFGITEWEFPSYVINEYHRANRIKYIQEAEKYASAIFNTPPSLYETKSSSPQEKKLNPSIKKLNIENFKLLFILLFFIINYPKILYL